MRIPTIRLLAAFLGAAVTLGFVPAAVAQAKTPAVTQIVALDECDPHSFNKVLGPDFCHNVALAAVVAIHASTAHAVTCNTLSAATRCLRV